MEAMKPREESIVRIERVRAPGRKRQMTSLIVLLIVVLVGVVAAYFLARPSDNKKEITNYSVAKVARGNLENVVEVSGTVQVEKQANIVSPQAGLVQSVLVDVGTKVRANQLVAVLKVENLEVNLASQKSAYQKALRDKEVSALSQTYSLQEMDRQKPSLEKALVTAQSNLKQTQDLFKLKAKSQTDVDNAQSAVDSAQKNLEDLAANREKAVATYDLQSRNTDADLEDQKASIARLEAQIAECNVVSTITGQVLNVNTSLGAWVGQYTTLLTVGDMTKISVLVQVPETQVSSVTPGQSVRITIAGQTYSGKVGKLAATAKADSTNYTASVDTTIYFDKTPDGIAPGTSATVDILVGTKANTLYLPRGPWLASGEKAYVFKVNGSTADKTAVTFGLMLTDKVEVLTGLNEGDTIIVSTYQDIISEDSVQLKDKGAKK